MEELGTIYRGRAGTGGWRLTAGGLLAAGAALSLLASCASHRDGIAGVPGETKAGTLIDAGSKAIGEVLP